jgi:hypothetical protein
MVIAVVRTLVRTNHDDLSRFLHDRAAALTQKKLTF